MRWLLLVAIASSACYHTTHEVACQASCSADNPACPGTTACGLDFLCHGEGEADCGDASVFVIPDVPLCLGVGIPDFAPDCPAVIPSASVDLAGSFDTDDDARCSAIDHQLDATSACIVRGGTIHVTGRFAPTGTRPLALIAFGDLVVDGAIDVAAHAGSAARPPDGDDPRCTTSPGNDDLGGGNGGAGGSFGTSGGGGGLGDGSPFGAAQPPATDAGRALRGGCPGSRGGNSSSAPNGGHGGGAIYLVARDALTVNATIDASGSGALATAAHGGGGGGGSGGMIVLEAGTIHVAATVFADGGGAGGGGAAVAGGAGADPTPALAGMGAPGGGNASTTTGQDASGPGGRGSSLTMKTGQRGVDALGVNHGAGCGGGGGGGGAGHVFILSNHPAIDPGVVVSPVEG